LTPRAWLEPTPAPSALTFWAATERAETAHAAAIDAERQEAAAVLALQPCQDATTGVSVGPGRRRAKPTWIFERAPRDQNHDGPHAPVFGDLCRAQDDVSVVACPPGCRRVTGEPHCAAGNSSSSSSSSVVGAGAAPCRLTAALLTRARADAYAALVAQRGKAKRAARVAERASERKVAIQKREAAANTEADREAEIERREAEANIEAEAEAAIFAAAKAAALAAVVLPSLVARKPGDLAAHLAARVILDASAEAQSQVAAADTARAAAAAARQPPLTLTRGVALATHMAALDAAAAAAQPHARGALGGSADGNDSAAAAQLEAWRDATFFACFDNGEAYGAAWFASTASVFRRTVATGPREHMETAGGLGLPPGNTPLKTVDLLDFSVEHISWLDRRLGLRYMQAPLKARLTAELLARLKARELTARHDALLQQAARLRLKEATSAQARQRRRQLAEEKQPPQQLRRRRLGKRDENPVPDGQPGATQKSAVPSANETAPWQGEFDGAGGEANARTRARPVKVLAAFPYFATTDHCGETGPAASKEGQIGQASAEPGARCDSGSSDPLLRRYFLNLTFWTVRVWSLALPTSKATFLWLHLRYRSAERGFLGLCACVHFGLMIYTYFF
jgi:hypothetical protein